MFCVKDNNRGLIGLLTDKLMGEAFLMGFNQLLSAKQVHLPLTMPSSDSQSIYI